MNLFRANTETEFNEIVNELKANGYVWATDFPKEPTYKECKKSTFSSNCHLQVILSVLTVPSSFSQVTNIVASLLSS